jgi:hypothetical protein
VSSFRPTVIGGKVPASPDAPAAAPMPAPTVIGAGVRAGVSAPQPPSTAEVSRLPGQPRRPLQIDRTTLASRFTGTPPEVIDELMTQISLHIPKAMDALEGERLGRATQQAYAEALDRALAWSQHKSVRTGQRHLTRLREVLTEVADHFDGRTWNWLRRRSAASRLTSAMSELQALKNLLQQAHQELDHLRQGLDTVLAELATLQRVTLAQVLLVEVLTPHVSPAAQASVLARGLSLAQTAEQIRQQWQQTRQVHSDVGHLSSTLHDAVWVQLPAWLSTVGALPESALTDTQRYQVADSVQTFLHHIQ